MHAVDKDVRSSVKLMKKRFRALALSKKSPLNQKDYSVMAVAVDAFRNELEDLSQVLAKAMLLTPKDDADMPGLSVPHGTQANNSISDSGNESCSEKSCSSPPPPLPPSSIINEDVSTRIARLQASRLSRRMKGDELRLSLEKSQFIQEEIKKRFAETKARRDSLGQ